MIIRKVILLGEIGVGKTSIARRLAFGTFGDVYKATIGADIYRYEVVPPPIAGTPFQFLVWDTDGSHGESIFRLFYARQAQAAMIVGDATRPSSIESMVRLGQRFSDEVPGRFFAHVINKLDLTGDQVPAALARRLEASKVPIYSTSAKTGRSVSEAFAEAAGEIVKLEGLKGAV
jgi:Ras-related protein Rab-5C